MSDIRITYSGLISLSLNIVKIFSGLAFTLIITRLLIPEELGSWRLILGLTSYVLISHIIISFWSTRETARNLESAKTALVSGGFFSVIGLLVYFGISWFSGNQTDAELDILFFGSILIPFMMFFKILLAINLAIKPHALSYGQLIYSLSMIPLAITTLVFFDLGIKGVIISSSFAYLFAIIFLIYTANSQIKNKIDFLYLKTWLKRSWLSMYHNLYSFIISLDVFVFTIISGSVLGLAYFTASWSIGILSGTASSIAIGLYPKLLGGGKHEYLKQNLNLLFYFSIPMVSITIVFAKPGLFALNPIYVAVFPAIIFISIRTMFYTLSNVFSNNLLGIEKIDTNLESTFNDYLKSRIFSVPTIRLIRNSSYIILLSLTVIFFINSDVIDLIIYWSVVSMISEIPFTLYFYKKIKEDFKISLNYSLITKYILSSLAAFGLSGLLADRFLVYDPQLLNFLPQLLIYVGFGLLLYLVITLSVDNNTRRLVKTIFREIKK